MYYKYKYNMYYKLYTLISNSLHGNNCDRFYHVPSPCAQSYHERAEATAEVGGQTSLRQSWGTTSQLDFPK